MREIALWMAYLKTKIRRKYCYHVSDGTVIYLVTPLWVLDEVDHDGPILILLIHHLPEPVPMRQ